METKEVIKNELREKMKDLSKDDLIDIIADMSSIYVMGRVAAVWASAMGISSTPNVRTDLQSIASSVASSLADKENLNFQVCEIDKSFYFKE